MAQVIGCIISIVIAGWFFVSARSIGRSEIGWVWYTSPRQTIWSFELLIPMLTGGLPGGLIWYYMLKAAALPQLKDEIQQAMLNENNN